MIAACFSVWYVPNSLELFRSYEILKAVVWVALFNSLLLCSYAYGLSLGGVLAVVRIALAGSITGAIKFFIIYYNKITFKGSISLVNYKA